MKFVLYIQKSLIKVPLQRGLIVLTKNSIELFFQIFQQRQQLNVVDVNSLSFNLREKSPFFWYFQGNQKSLVMLTEKEFQITPPLFQQTQIKIQPILILESYYYYCC
eukprot:TRINITY_DN1543_c1_g2_i1.p3 TRINITY_DN1543_c1_g2~~TRINITY_DN1543_c1_g2_i1.p3  ORF type:complete len:107 (-),score=2.89 TRINITY_DN1543_c1_g2_i1:371-691(-)